MKSLSHTELFQYEYEFCHKYVNSVRWIFVKPDGILIFFEYSSKSDGINVLYCMGIVQLVIGLCSVLLRAFYQLRKGLILSRNYRPKEMHSESEERKIWK